MTGPELDDVELLASELADFAQPEKAAGRSPRDERIIAGFEDIQRFYERFGRVPQSGAERDIFERLYAVRLARLRALPDCHSLLEPLDCHSLLTGAPETPPDMDALARELGSDGSTDDIAVLRHVRPAAQKRAAQDVANRKPCADFARFKPLFARVNREVKTGVRQSRPIQSGERAIAAGNFFVLGGLVLYVAEAGPPLKVTAKEVDRRLRVIFSNGTESNLLLRSLQRAFYGDPTARRLVLPDNRQLSLDDALHGSDVENGTIYVLRSLSDHPLVAAHREVLHKIGVTGGDVARRIVNARLEPTFLMADVEIVATYTLYNIHRVKLEKLIHRVFAPAQMDIEIQDRFGNPVVPREWFLVPHFIVDEAVARIKDGTITDYLYDPQTARLLQAQDAASESTPAC